MLELRLRALNINKRSMVLTGGNASGKSFIARAIAELFKKDEVKFITERRFEKADFGNELLENARLIIIACLIKNFAIQMELLILFDYLKLELPQN